eukprot:363175-Rhodomonas_salina.1
MSHWQCICPQFRESRVAAHNFIWTVLANKLTATSPSFTIELERPMRNMKLKVNPKFQHWQPDCIAYGPDNLIFLLEFTRCSDSDTRQSKILEALERKEI